MGNWMTVWITGTCSPTEVAALRQELILDYKSEEPKELHCLDYTGGLAGLPNWAAETITAVGNLAERGFVPESIVYELERLALTAPSLAVRVHCGGDYESPECVATVVLENGKATIKKPEIATIPGIPETQMAGEFLKALGRL